LVRLSAASNFAQTDFSCAKTFDKKQPCFTPKTFSPTYHAGLASQRQWLQSVAHNPLLFPQMVLNSVNGTLNFISVDGISKTMIGAFYRRTERTKGTTTLEVQFP
jgi:hypothetical protein